MLIPLIPVNQLKFCNGQFTLLVEDIEDCDALAAKFEAILQEMCKIWLLSVKEKLEMPEKPPKRKRKATVKKTLSDWVKAARYCPITNEKNSTRGLTWLHTLTG